MIYNETQSTAIDRNESQIIAFNRKLPLRNVIKRNGTQVL